MGQALSSDAHFIASVWLSRTRRACARASSEDLSASAPAARAAVTDARASTSTERRTRSRLSMPDLRLKMLFMASCVWRSLSSFSALRSSALGREKWDALGAGENSLAAGYGGLNSEIR